MWCEVGRAQCHGAHTSPASDQGSRWLSSGTAKIAFLSKLGSALSPEEADYSCWPLLAASCHGETDGLVTGAVYQGLTAAMLKTVKKNPQT